MEPILQVLDRQWPGVATAPEARRAVMRWANEHRVLVGMRDLEDVLRSRHDGALAGEVQRVLAHLAPTDELATRALLQILLPGLVRLVGTVGHPDPDAADEIVALAWERIRTYPTSRHGSVAANVVLDVRKRYLGLRRSDSPLTLHPVDQSASDSSLPEDQVLATMQLEEIVEATRNGIIQPTAFEAILRTRLGGESLAEVAVSHGVTTEMLCQRRWRAEQRIRALPLAS